MNCLCKPKIKPIEFEITELDIIKNKIRLKNEIINVIITDFKEKLRKIKETWNSFIK